jgi:UDP-arabinose 4-epimerase
LSIHVTGGASCIGSHTCKALAQAGYTPFCYDKLFDAHRWAVRWGPFEEGDIADRARLAAVLTQYQPAAVMHFAAYAYVGESVQDPCKTYRNNLGGTLTLLETLRDHGIDQLVFSSTCATYGASKQMVERLLQDIGTAHGRHLHLRLHQRRRPRPCA